MQLLSVILLCVATIGANPLKGETLFVSFEALDDRIINGENATRSQFPWQVAIVPTGLDSPSLCSGALISDSWVLTAAQCVRSATNFRIYLGSTLLAGDDTDRVVLETDMYIKHENYSFWPWTEGNDIALIPLPEAVTLTDTIQPIALSDGVIDQRTNVTVSGWGQTTDSCTNGSNNLMYTNLLTIPNLACEHDYGFTLSSVIGCAQTFGGIFHGACEGDAGGPFVVGAESSKPMHVGIASFGFIGKPVGFTRTSSYRDWIREKTGI